MFLDKFILPIDREDKIVSVRMAENGGIYGYVDNIYPCGIFSRNNFSEVDFSNITVFYGGNGSGNRAFVF